MNLQQIHALLDPDGRVAHHLAQQNERISSRDIDCMFHPSSFGGCARRLSYAFMGMIPTHRIDPKLRRTFSHGHAIHEMLQAAMGDIYNGLLSGTKGYHATFTPEVSITDRDLAKEWHIAGSADGVITIETDDYEEVARVIYEAKSASESSWSGTGKPQPKHLMQATVYAKCLGADAILFEYYNKDKDVSKYFLVPPDEASWEAVKSTLTEVIARANKGELMPGEHSYECRTCPYYTECKPELR